MALQRVGHDWATNTLTFHFFIVNFAYLWNWLLEFGHSLGHGKPCFTPQFNLNLLKITYSFIELPLKRYHIPVLVCLCAKSLQSCLTPCNPMNCSLPVSVHVILQARILEWVVMLFSKGSSQPRDQTCISWIGRVFFFFSQPLAPSGKSQLCVHHCANHWNFSPCQTTEMWTLTWRGTVVSVMKTWGRHRQGRRGEITPLDQTQPS